MLSSPSTSSASGRVRRPALVLVLQVSFVGFGLGIIPTSWQREAHAQVVGQSVSFWYDQGGRRFTGTGQISAVTPTQVRVRYQGGGQLLSRWVLRSNITLHAGTGNLVHTCGRGDRIYHTGTGRRVCCPSTATGYHTRSRGDVICCPAGTSGVLSGQHHVTCAHSAARTSACQPGHTLFRAHSGKGYCCPPGTRGFFQGSNGITCQRSGGAHHPTGGTNYGSAKSGTTTSCPAGSQAYLVRSTQKKFCCPAGSRGNVYNGTCSPVKASRCPPLNDMGRTPASCAKIRRTSWKCSPFQLADGTQCQRCNCHY